jgi:hypothetical protein
VVGQGVKMRLSTDLAGILQLDLANDIKGLAVVGMRANSVKP